MHPSKSFFFAALTITCVLPLGCATNEASLREKGATPLGAAEVKGLMVTGKPIKGRAADSGYEYAATFNPDGSASVSWDNGSDTGSWRMEGDRFCGKWKVIRNGQEVCSSVYRIGPNEYQMFRPDGNLQSTLKTP